MFFPPYRTPKEISVYNKYNNLDYVHRDPLLYISADTMGA